MYKDVRKNVFVNKYEKVNMVKNYASFLKKIEELKPFFDRVS